MEPKAIIELINGFKPSQEEIRATIEEDDELLYSIVDMYDYKVNEQVLDHGSEIWNIVFNTNISEKGLAEFHFIPAHGPDSIAYTEDDDIFFLIGGVIVLDNDLGRIPICNIQADFMTGMICCLHANVDFVFRKHIFNVENYIQLIENQVADPKNAIYFVNRLNLAYG